MIYREFKDKKLSLLGMGCMRLPGDGYGNEFIDEAEAEKMFDYAISKGVNYFDTAWGYHAGQSEIVTGKLLAKYPRDSYYIATKFPGYDLSNMDKVEEIFEKQLVKTGMDYFDFYLFHNVCEMNIDAYLNREYGIMDYLLKQKESGRIRHLGFSVHGNLETTKRFLDAYGEHMEFCQIQLNWLDWDFQDAKAKVELLNELNIPVWVMEPLRGGRLAQLGEADTAKLNALRPGVSVPEWAFRYVESVPGVKMILSGMSNFDQMKENIATFEKSEPLSECEINTLYEIAKGMTDIVPCTTCRYCVEACPQGINIPVMIKLYNEHVFTGGGFIAPMMLTSVPEENRPSACIGCRACEALCPQQIKIADVMADFVEKLKA